MTYRMLRRETEDQLRGAGNDNSAFDTACLIEDLAGVPRGQLPLWYDREAPAAACEAVRAAARRRAVGEPLQYILGEWAFLGLTLSVGPGVLIPRPETELLCETAAALLGKAGTAAPRVLDLCAGSGCVGLGLASLLPGARVTAVEWSPEAYRYLERNIARYPAYHVEAVRADVLREAGRFGGGWQAILANPPYIPTADLPGLMREVQREPAMALDVGYGYRFYRVIAREWVPLLAAGGICAVEVGIGQAETVAGMWRSAGLEEVRICRDAAGIPRVVSGRRG